MIQFLAVFLQLLSPNPNLLINLSADTTFVNLREYSSDFVYEMKYATNDNFLKTNVYPCDHCFLRKSTALALINANQDFLKLGYRIKIYDCYRPLDIQKKMFEIVSNPKYVADPKKGSVHNKGGAVDITLVDMQGNEIYMGTTFDYFGKEAAHDFTNLPKQVLENRILLKKIMIKNGFSPIKSEWWHYNLNGSTDFKISNHQWNCDE